MAEQITTKKNKKFWRNAYLICILAFVAQYFYSCLGNDVLNVLKPYLADTHGWTATQLTMPSTVGGIVNIPFSFVTMTIAMKIGPRKSAALGLFISALGVLGIAISSSYIMYWVALFVVKVVNNLLNASIMAWVVRWFHDYKGRALGFITIGSPANSATSVALMTAGCVSMGFQKTFIIVTIIVALCGVIMLIFGKDQPESIGCHVDGKDADVEYVVDKYEDVIAAWPIKKIFGHRECWTLFLAWGFGGFCIFGIMAFFIARATMIGFNMAAAVSIMSVSAIVAVPFSYIFGWVDDKFGTKLASILMYALVAIGLVGLWKADVWAPGMYLGGFGGAVLTGAFPNLVSSHCMGVYGNRAFQHVRRYQGILTSIPAAFGVTVFAGILDKTGSLNNAYLLCIAMCIVSIIGLLLTRRTFDPENPNAVPIPGNTEVGFIAAK